MISFGHTSPLHCLVTLSRVVSLPPPPKKKEKLISHNPAEGTQQQKRIRNILFMCYVYIYTHETGSEDFDTS